MSIYTDLFESPLSNAESGILHGLKFSVKDNIDVVGHATTCGVRPSYLEHAPRSAAVVSMLLNAGAELVGKTNMDPFAAHGSGKNEFYGDVRHPVFDRAPCLGSSSGAAASVIVDNLDFALGTDSGGSIRAPAASCNLYGIKFKNSSLDMTGVCLSDALLESFGVLTRDTLTLQKVCEALGVEAQYREKVQVYIPDTQTLSICDHEVQKRFYEWLEEIADNEIVEWPHGELFQRSSEARKPLVSRGIATQLQSWPGNYTEALLALKIYSESLSDEALSDARTAIRSIRREISRVLPMQAVLVTPTLPYDPLSERSFSRAQPLNYFLPIANVSDCAAISAPLDHPYHSVQILGHSENIVIAALEQLF